jgi:hypothetical protein
MLAALVVSVLTAVAPAQKPIATLPQVYVDTTWNPPLGGTTWGAHTSAQLSNAITHSLPGDVIVLDAGVTYSGAFQLPAKVNPNKKWIYIVSSAIAKLPAGTRVSPASAVNMPKIVTPSVAPAFQVNGGANHWRLAGLELTAASNYPSGCPGNGQNCMTYFLMGSQSNPTPEPDSIALDRCYIHGSPTQDLQSAVQMHASNYAVVDSYIDDVHIKGLDSVGLLSCWSPGPIKIMNNYVAASTENIMLGGCGGTGTPWVPSDVEIRNNYLFKPLSWVVASVTNKSMVVKDAFELKSAQRVLFDSNTIENVWANGQTGFAIVLIVRTSQSGDIAVVNDITITNNVLKNVVSGINTAGADNTCSPAYGYPNCHNAGSQDRWYIANNLMTFYDPTQLGGSHNLGFQPQMGTDSINGINVPLRDVVFQHNTMVAAASTPCYQSVYFSTANMVRPIAHVTTNVWILDNVLCRQPTGDWGYVGASGMTQYMGDPSTPPYDLTQRYYGNVMYVPPGEKLQTWPLHSYATTLPFSYANSAITNYQILTLKRTDTSDGKLAGINFVALPH